MNKKNHLLNYTLPELEEYFLEQGEKRYRGKQVFSWIYAKEASHPTAMTDLPITLRENLTKKAEIWQSTIVQTTPSPEGDTIKFLLRLIDGKKIETVFIKEYKRFTVCVSTQVGCALDCTFCATAQMGFFRNLTTGEIVEQVLSVKRTTGEPVTNIVFMGMGEPFLNYDNVVRAADILSNQNGLRIAARRITISTAGIVPAIIRFTDEGHRYKLAVSLNSPDNKQRTLLMPLNKKYSIKKVIEAANYYTRHSNKKITLEYVLIQGINDRERDARELIRTVHGLRCKVNLIPFNSIDSTFQKPLKCDIESFHSLLLSAGISVTIRWSRGDNIDAACGQLVVKNSVSNADSKNNNGLNNHGLDNHRLNNHGLQSEL